MSPASAMQRLPGLIEAAAAVVGAGDLEQVLRQLVSEARAATGAKYAALGVIGSHGVLTEFIHEGMTPEEVERVGTLPSGRGVLGTVVRKKATIRLESISDHSDFYGFPPNHPVMTNFLGVPVTAGGEAFGNLYLTEKEGGFTDDDVVIVEALSRIAGSAVSNARLHERLRSIALVEDRERIARDLHDSVIQNLFALGLSLQSIAARTNDTAVSTTLDTAVDRLDHVVEALRDYIFQLRSTPQRRELDDRLQDLVSRMGSAYPVEVTLDIEVTELGDESLEDEVVKLVTEALSNALRHARAGRIEVAVYGNEEHCRLLVADDGTGFDPDRVESGMGLANMSARARRRGGKATVTSVVGEGTTVEVVLPLR